MMMIKNGDIDDNDISGAYFVSVLKGEILREWTECNLMLMPLQHAEWHIMSAQQF